MARLILVRHAESVSNRDRRALGRGDPPLTEVGLSQTLALRAALRDETLHCVLSSPLRRAYHTAEAIAAEHGLEVQAEEGLTELDIGDMEGLSYAQAQERYPQILAAWRGETGATVRMPGGETVAEVQERAWAVVEPILAAVGNESTVVVTHNWVLRAIICRAQAIDLNEFHRYEVGLASRTVLDYVNGRGVLRVFNDARHLDGAPS